MKLLIIGLLTIGTLSAQASMLEINADSNDSGTVFDSCTCSSETRTRMSSLDLFTVSLQGQAYMKKADGSVHLTSNVLATIEGRDNGNTQAEAKKECLKQIKSLQKQRVCPK